MAKYRHRAAWSARGSGARQWTCQLAAVIEFFIIFIFAAGGALSAQEAVGGVNPAALVAEAGRPETFYGAPARRDSLIAILAGLSAEDEGLEQLFALLDTPWAIHFEVLKRAIIKAGDPARKMLIQKIVKGKLSGRTNVLLLVVFEQTGRAGDETHLAKPFASDDPQEKIWAARCLASFGGNTQESARLLKPLFSHPENRVRLAAARAAARLHERKPRPETAKLYAESIRLLIKNPHPLVRFTAAETLRILGESDKNLPRPLYPGW